MKKLIVVFSIFTLGFYVSSCEYIAKPASKSLAKKLAKEAGEEVLEEAIEKGSRKAAREVIEEGIEKGSRKAVKEVVEEGVEVTGKRTLKGLSASNKELKKLYESFSSRISKDFADDIAVSQEKQWTRYFSKKFPNSEIKTSGNTVVAKAGSTKSSGAVNEFLNHLLPNKTYIVDDAFTYKTDELGRQAYCYADRTKAFNSISRNTQRNSNIQKDVVRLLNGKEGLDDAGHLFANNTGGPNELINQVPMNANLNRNGQWRQLERMEEQALREGKKVISIRKLHYKGDSKRPYAIEFISKINGKETKVVVKNI